VQADHALRALGHRREVDHGDGRGVRGQQGAVADGGVEPSPGVELDLERLGHGLDHEVAVREVLVRGGAADALAGGAGLVVGEPAALHGAVELRLDGLEPAPQGALVDLAEHDLEAGLGADLRDAAAHLPRPEHPDALDPPAPALHRRPSLEDEAGAPVLEVMRLVASGVEHARRPRPGASGSVTRTMATGPKRPPANVSRRASAARSAPPVTPAAVPIVGGTGALGFGLGLRLANAGVPVVIGSRRAEAAVEAAARLRERVPDGDVEGLPNAEAATRGPLVVLSVPFRAQSENLTNLRGVLQPGQVLLDATVPLAAAVSGRATRLLGVPQGSAAEQAQEMAPEGVRVVSALHTISAKNLADLDFAFDEDVLVAGDDGEAKRQVAELVARVPGLRPVDCGALERARLTEGLTPLLIAVNARYKAHAGIRLVGLGDRDPW
jgi:NADPH-dependent F420 reductase